MRPFKVQRILLIRLKTYFKDYIKSALNEQPQQLTLNMLKSPLAIFIFLSITSLVLAQKCKKPPVNIKNHSLQLFLFLKGSVGDVRYEGCDKYECVKASKKRGKWVGPTIAR